MQNKNIAYAALLGLALTAVSAEDGFAGESPNDAAKIVDAKADKNRSNQNITQGKPKSKKDGGIAIGITGQGTGVVYNVKNSKGARHQNGGKVTNLGVSIDESAVGLVFTGETASFGGLDFGGKLSLAVDNYNDGGTFKDVYVNVGNENVWGILYIGNLKGVEYRMANHVKYTQTGLGGVADNSDAQNALINVASGVQHLQTHLKYGSSRAIKAMWLSPKVSGFQAGVSYTPNTNSLSAGAIKSSMITGSWPLDPISPNNQNMHKGLTSFGLSWDKKMSNGATAKLGAVLMTGATRVYYWKVENYGTGRDVYNPATINRHKVFAYTLAAGLEYKGVEAGLQYLDNGKSGEAKDFKGRKGQKGYAAGLGYNWGVNKVGLGYQHIVRKNGTAPAGYTPVTGGSVTSRSFSKVGLGKSSADTYGVQYQHVVTEGLTAFAEYAHVRSTTSTENFQLAQIHDVTSAVRKNSGHAFLVGMGFYF